MTTQFDFFGKMNSGHNGVLTSAKFLDKKIPYMKINGRHTTIPCDIKETDEFESEMKLTLTIETDERNNP